MRSDDPPSARSRPGPERPERPARPARRPGTATVLPLSFAQRRMWLIEQFADGTPVFTLPLVQRLIGPLDVEALRGALDHMVRRHAALRTTLIDQGGEPVQVVAPTASSEFTVADLTAGATEADSPDRRARAADTFAAAAAGHGFDLRRGPLIRAALGRLAPHDHVLAVTVHHAVADSWSLAVLCDEISAAYREAVDGVPAALPPLPVQFPQLAAAQRTQSAGAAGRAAVGFWTRHLAGVPELLSLPTDRPRPAIQSFRAARLVRVVGDSGMGDRLDRAARGMDATPFMVLLAAWAATLGRFAGQPDVVVGTPVTGRIGPAVERVVGCLVNLVPLRVRIAGDPTFAELVERVRESTVDGLAHADVPLDLLVEALRPDRTLGHSPLFQTQLSMRTAPDPRLDLSDVDAVAVPVDPGSMTTDLALQAHVRPTGELSVALDRRVDIFDATTGEQLLDAFVAILTAGLADPGQRLTELTPLTAAARRRALADGTGITRPLPAAVTALDLIRPADPDAVAVRAADGELTYAELLRRAHRLGHALRTAGVRPDRPVAVCLDRTTALLTSVLGIWSAGAAYVPLDPSWPVDRLRYMLDDSGAQLLITSSAVRHRLGELVDSYTGTLLDVDERAAGLSRNPTTPPAVTVTGEHLAYVIHTSGSTGRPKGVGVPHRAVVNLLTAYADLVGLTAADRFAAVTTLSFDISVPELLAPLLAGGQLLLVDTATAADGVALRRLLTGSGATMLQATPATWRLLLTAGGVPDDVRVRVCGGETLPRDLADRLLAGAGKPALWNMYGPTETTVWSTAGPVDRGSTPVPLGPPIHNTRCYVLDEALEPVPVGVVGQLHIGGLGVARGYHDRPALTAERFRPDPFAGTPGARMYATGDLVRHCRDGQLEFLGRTDRQVKIRGFRIEPGEIEAALRDDDLVGDAVVTAVPGPGGDVRLVAYVVAPAGRSAEHLAAGWSAVAGRLRQRLPDYMIPTARVVLPAFPRTPNGKTDRAALPTPDWRAHGTDGGRPRNPHEELIAGFWRDVLGVPFVDVHADFFAIGGHSLLAARVLSRVRAATAVQVPFREFFQSPTVAGLAAAVVEHSGGPAACAHCART